MYIQAMKCVIYRKLVYSLLLQVILQSLMPYFANITLKVGYSAIMQNTSSLVVADLATLLCKQPFDNNKQKELSSLSLIGFTSRIIYMVIVIIYMVIVIGC